MKKWLKKDVQAIVFNREGLPLNIVTNNIGRLCSFTITVQPDDSEMISLIFDDNTRADYILKDRLLDILDTEVEVDREYYDDRIVDFIFEKYMISDEFDTNTIVNSVNLEMISPVMIDEAV